MVSHTEGSLTLVLSTDAASYCLDNAAGNCSSLPILLRLQMLRREAVHAFAAMCENTCSFSALLLVWDIDMICFTAEVHRGNACSTCMCPNFSKRKTRLSIAVVEGDVKSS